MTKRKTKPAPRKWRGWVTVSAFDGQILDVIATKPLVAHGWIAVDIIERKRAPKRKGAK